jgi:hypothetical protein
MSFFFFLFFFFFYFFFFLSFSFSGFFPPVNVNGSFYRRTTQNTQGLKWTMLSKCSTHAQPPTRRPRPSSSISTASMTNRKRRIRNFAKSSFCLLLKPSLIVRASFSLLHNLLFLYFSLSSLTFLLLSSPFFSLSLILSFIRFPFSFLPSLYPFSLLLSHFNTFVSVRMQLRRKDRENDIDVQLLVFRPLRRRWPRFGTPNCPQIH